MSRDLRAVLGAIGLTGLFTTGCSDMNTRTFTLHGIKYEAPQSEIEAAALPPKSRLFVRLAPAGTDFHLILDEWSEFASYQGSDIPRISRLNDNRFQKFSVI